jgi:threonine/homoserine/homoserine lactone efflux protein
MSAVVLVLTHAIETGFAAATLAAFGVGSGDFVQAAATKAQAIASARIVLIGIPLKLASGGDARRAVYRRSAIRSASAR